MQMFREESEERLDRVVDTLLATERGEASDDSIHVVLRDVHSIKGAAGMLGITAAASVAHAMEDVLTDARQRGRLPHEAVDPLLHASDALRRAAQGESIDPDQALEGLAALNARPAPEDGEGASGQVDRDVPENQDAGSGDAPLAPEPLRRRSLRVDAAGLDAVVDTVGEALLHQRRLEHLLKETEAPSPEELDETLHRAALRLDDLRDAAIGLRMVPLASVTGPFPRMVRDLAAASGREVELTVTGAETQLDRAVLGGASEAIGHLLRNAVAHGIEPVDERERAGKHRRGSVELRARQEGDRVAIEVEDDGRGVAPDLVAKSDGPMSLVRVLAAPGLTRTQHATQLSGRGVGLDAVLEHVQRLGGELEARTETGRGTKFTLLLPISLALLHVLLAERGGVLVGIPMSAVVEVVQAGDPLVLRGRSSLEVRGEQVPLADPVVVLGGVPESLEGRRPAVIATAGGARAALACDAVLGDDELLIKPLGALLADTPGYLGVAVVGNGRIVLILDPVHVVPAAERQSVRFEPVAAQSAPDAPAPETARILVVDDQFTAREIQRSILEAAGYSVVTARDGREAWDLLKNGESVKLVVTDLEMPEMDGLALVRTIRSDPTWSSVPVVVVTSRGGEADEREGLEAGADAYVVKQRFDQRALLDTVERLVAT
jgi:two-component system, chemotaxis family, sensor kinase CheA